MLNLTKEWLREVTLSLFHYQELNVYKNHLRRSNKVIQVDQSQRATKSCHDINDNLNIKRQIVIHWVVSDLFVH